MRNSEKRKVKRSFPRPKASAILGLEQEGLFSMQNTISTNNNKRVSAVELLMDNTKEVNNMISSIENSSVEQNQQMNPKLDTLKAEFLDKVAEEEAKGIAAHQSAQPELAHPP